ncbi:MAG: hypothetical protein RL198_961 [Actinomycetota bacterium]
MGLLEQAGRADGTGCCEALKLRAITDASRFAGKRVLFRADFNVPLNDSGEIGDDGRIRAALPTLTKLLEAGAMVVVCSHLGRPEGKPDPRYSLAPVAARLEQLLGQPVGFAADTVGVEANGMSRALAPGGIGLIENLRFHAEETSKVLEERQDFAKRLAALGEVFVNDAFGVVHRNQASVVEVADLLEGWAGDLMAKEVAVLQSLVEGAERPYTVVLGGAKVSDKLGVLANLLPRVDRVLIGGGMVFTVLAAKGFEIASSLFEPDAVSAVASLFDRARELDVKIVLPTDILVANRFATDAEFETVDVSRLNGSRFGELAIGLDIGPATAANFAKHIRESKTVFWNGPMGVFEFPAFSGGTRAVAEALAAVAGLSVVGGGDSASAIRALGFSDSDFDHVSTGGGASLEFLEGKKLPGLEPLYAN